MEEQSRVIVKVYGQEFTISGDQPRSHIMKIADHVDGKMHELAEELPSCSTGMLAMLTAVNTADEYYQVIAGIEELKMKNAQLEKDAQHYVQLWDEAKRNFLQHKEDAQQAIEQKDALQRQLAEKIEELRELRAQYLSSEEQRDVLQRKIDNLMERVVAQEEEKESGLAVVKEMEYRCKDMENSFFDLQMENIQLKAELDRYKNIVE
jgi:cell division protein ZapA